MRVPPKKSGKGKITLTMQERFVEVEAMTMDKNYLDTGITVKITGLESDNIVIVERI